MLLVVEFNRRFAVCEHKFGSFESWTDEQAEVAARFCNAAL